MKIRKNLYIPKFGNYFILFSLLIFLGACFTSPSSGDQSGTNQEEEKDVLEDVELNPSEANSNQWVFVSGQGIEGEMHLKFRSLETEEESTFFIGPNQPKPDYDLLIDLNNAIQGNPDYIDKTFELEYLFEPVVSMIGDDVEMNVIKSILLIE